MKLRSLMCVLAAVCAVSLPARAADEPAAPRNRSGTINHAPRPAVFVVVAVDRYNRIVRLRGRHGATSEVRVGEQVYDLSKLKPGDRIRVDFLVPDDVDRRLAAATIWPVR